MKAKMHNKKRNVITALISQVVTTACGVVIPHVMISAFGSVIYGLTTSIAQFLSYITLLEGGITSVARAELYGALTAQNDWEISKVYHAIKRFFAMVGVAFLAYTLIISLAYYDMAQVTNVGRTYVFFLVWIISAGTLAKYLGGLSNLTLIVADQKQYIMNAIVTVVTVANAILVVILARSQCDVLVVKIGSSLVFVAQPICYGIYVKRHYNLQTVGKNRSKLQQKWTGMAQHAAYFIHRNVDVVVLTLFANLRYVAVYSVYRLVISSIRNITASFSSGMEAACGEMIAKKEQTLLQRLFFKYKHILSFMSIVLFGTTAMLIVPFVRLYTQGVTDADYIQPVFAMVLLFAEAIDCFMQPCWSLPVSANKIKQTRWGSYGEAIINVTLSLILVWWNPLVGIALATLIATVFKAAFYMVYAGKKILCIRLWQLLKNCMLTIGMIGLCALAGVFVVGRVPMESYVMWILWGVGTVGAVSVITAAVYYVVYPTEFKEMLISILHQFKHR